MRAPRWWLRLRLVEKTLTRIVIDLELSAGKIAGLLSDGDGGVWPFHGWMELAAAIEAAALDTKGARK
jgi:hypothetical protein